MKEDRAAAPLGAAAEILVEHEGEVVEMVLAPHSVGAVCGGQANGAIVARACRILAPALIATHRHERHARSRRPQAVGTIVAPEQREAPDGRAAIAFALDPDES